MGASINNNLKENLAKFLIRIELDAKKVGLSSIVIKQLKEDCQIVIGKEAQFQI